MEKITTKEGLNAFISNCGDKLAVAKFSGSWCSPCRMLGRIIEEIAPNYADKVVFADIEADDAEDGMLEELNITNIPVLAFYKNGLMVDRTVGMIGKDALINKIEENYNK